MTTRDDTSTSEDPTQAVREWATATIGAVILGGVAFITAIVFHIAWLVTVASLIGPICTAGVVVALSRLARASGARRADVIRLIGITGSLGSFAAVLGAAFDVSFASVVSFVSGLLLSIWAVSIGESSRRDAWLPAPLPRRALIGGLGVGVSSVALVIDPSPLSPLGIVGLVLTLPYLGFIFGLTRLGASAEAPAEVS